MQLLWQSTLPGWAGESAVSYRRLERVRLDADSWVDYCPGWLAEADELMADLASTASWTQRERPMYDAMVMEPRLVTGWALGEVPPTVEALRASLSAQYRVTFDSVHVNLYRSGSDSVAWHGDTVRKVLREPLVAIVSLGERRRFRLRPRGGGPAAASFALGGGDLLVMGGACQHLWEHSVPKTARHVSPRMSVTFRHSE
ncbi:MAG TPA: alpha-ketoglutarate-dependent dioxygenase AlkB [Frankiaceae bacterium]|nr:alpha-ketoglutarate-dependent dioxygenase AlkB [Frankiaceae bacterium]